MIPHESRSYKRGYDYMNLNLSDVQRKEICHYSNTSLLGSYTQTRCCCWADNFNWDINELQSLDRDFGDTCSEKLFTDEYYVGVFEKAESLQNYGNVGIFDNIPYVSLYLKEKRKEEIKLQQQEQINNLFNETSTKLQEVPATLTSAIGVTMSVVILFIAIVMGVRWILHRIKGI